MKTNSVRLWKTKEETREILSAKSLGNVAGPLNEMH